MLIDFTAKISNTDLPFDKVYWHKPMVS